MKFGKSIGSQQDGNQDLHYVDYKILKKRIKDVVEQLQAHEPNKALRLNTEFERELEAEIEQVNSCFGGCLTGLLDETSKLSEDLHLDAHCAAAAPSGPVPAASAGDGPIESLTRPGAFRRLVDILGKVDVLRKYAVWNAVGVVKILKKRRKLTRFGIEDTAAERAAWLSRQSFFSGSDFAELHARIESVGHVLVLSELTKSGEGQKLEPQPQEPVQCPICLDTISDTVQLSCSHRFCWKCFVLGPIAFQPGEYRITQCPICRTETSLPGDGSDGSDLLGAMGHGIAGSEGLLTRFLHTYFPKGSGRTAIEEAAEQEARQEGEQTDEETRDAVRTLVKAMLSDDRGGDEESMQEPSAGSASSWVPGNFFQTLPQKSPQDKQQLGRAQKLQWLQLAENGDSFALESTMYCSLCSEPLLMEAVVTTPCKHHFHRVCISRLEEPKCPLCSFELPFSWFVPAEHPCAGCGFHVVPAKKYRPAFPGGPSRGSHGYPLHRPPPVNLIGPGITMRSYLHKVMPTPSEEDSDAEGSPESPAAANRLAAADSPEDGSRSSESSSEESDSEDGVDRPTHGDHASLKGKAYGRGYSTLGRMRLLKISSAAPAPDARERADDDLAERQQVSVALGPARSSAASSSDGSVSGSAPAFVQPGHRSPRTLLLGGLL